MSSSQTLPRRWQCLIFMALVAVPSITAAPPDDAISTELQPHQGTWSVESSIFDGQPAPEALAKSIQMIVTGDHVVWKRDGKSFAGTKIVLNAATKSNTIDVIPDGGRYMGEHVLGIYRFDETLLTICMASPGKPRPTELKADKGSGCTLRVFRRASVPGK